MEDLFQAYLKNERMPFFENWLQTLSVLNKKFESNRFSFAFDIFRMKG